MAGELTEALSKARAAVDTAGECWESAPQDSEADASHRCRRDSGALAAAADAHVVQERLQQPPEDPERTSQNVAGSTTEARWESEGQVEAQGAQVASHGMPSDGGNEPEKGEGASREDDEEVPVRVYDGIPLVKEAADLKEQGNACFKNKKHQEAAKLYQQGVAVLKRSDGHPMLREEKDELDTLRAVLHCNIAQCMWGLELYRRSIDSATEALKWDKTNAKALHRRSQAHEFFKEYEDALRDLLALKKLGGGGLDPKALEKRCEELYEKQIAENKAVNEMGKANEDLFKMKERFDEVMEKYDLGDGSAAPLVAHWLHTDGDFKQTVERVAKRWEMSKTDAEHFAKWIRKGVEMGVIPKPAQGPQKPPPA